MSRSTQGQLYTALAALGLLAAPGFVVVQLFPGIYHDRPLRIILAYVCMSVLTVPIWFKVNRYVMKRYTEPPKE